MSKKTVFRSYIVIPDTNILHVQDQDVPLDTLGQGFLSSWSTTKPDDNIQVTIPHVVLGELVYQRAIKFIDIHEKAQLGLKQLSQLISKPLPFNLSRQEIMNHVEKEVRRGLSSLGHVAFMDTPYATIAWKRVVHDSIWRNPPFERGEKEKGFRDAMILETVKSIVSLNPETSVFLLSNDGRMRLAAEQQLGHESHFRVYSSTDEFVSFVEAARARFAPEILLNVIDHARKAFFSEGDQSSFWYQNGVDSLLRVANHNFDNPSKYSNVFLALEELSDGEQPETDWQPLAEVQYKHGLTRFVGLVGERELRWQTNVRYVRQFERTYHSGMRDLHYTIEMLNVTWDVTVKWSCLTSDEGKLSDFSFLSSSAVLGASLRRS